METLKEILQEHRQRWKKKRKAKPVISYGVKSEEAFQAAISALNDLVKEETGFHFLYREYINSQYWRLRRALYVEHFNSTCQRCHKAFPKGLCLHHCNGYARLGQERVNDVKLICRRCHLISELEKEGDLV